MLKSVYDTSSIDLLVQKESRQEINCFAGSTINLESASGTGNRLAFQAIPLFAGYIETRARLFLLVINLA
jgi:hypothetical protein